MGQSYRIQTELGINKTINVQLDQEFEFLEILSLKIQQSDIYTRSCADYGVLVGRITANNGFGLPNARVSIFIPIDSIDESNPIIQSIYPYKSPNDKNDDGYRYNLLPYEKSYSKHAATGTLPSRNDALTASTVVEIYNKYYKFTAKTNESGDYMIMGVPLGTQTVFMDVDLSDIGEFSLTPQDLIRMGIATESQVGGNQFRTSTDLNSLPQIINLTVNADISPLWGDPDICQIAINRVDFDLRDSANIDIQPTAVFMGSMFTTPDSYRVRKNAKPRDDMGNLCNLQAGPGQILCVRQTIQQDSDGNPILEVYQLEQSGNIIDGSGTWLTELPMNLNYVITNQFGEKVLSNDPTIGIPTKGNYRFKIKWTQPPSISEQTRRPNYLVPNIKEYGWSNISTDPNNLSPNSTEGKKLAGSYYFGLDWSGYTNSQAAIDCEDTFYSFDFNKVYTIAGLIDEFKNGAKGRFIGIKEIDSNDCSSSVNKFPVNDGFRNFDLLYFVFSIILQVIQIIGIPLLIVYHFLAFLWNNFAVILLSLLITYFGYLGTQEVIAGNLALAGGTLSWGLIALAAPFYAKALLYGALIAILIAKFKQITAYKFGRFKLPMITYPECQACDCNGETTSPGGDSISDSSPTPGLLSQLSNSGLYFDSLVALEEKTTTTPTSDENYDLNVQISASIKSQAIAGNPNSPKKPNIFKNTQSQLQTYPNGVKQFTVSNTLPPGERINVYNTRNKYFQGINKIKVSFASNANTSFHYDNTLTVLSSQDLQPGDLLTFVSPAITTDSNYLWSGQTSVGGAVINGINGIITTNQFQATVNYALTQTTDTSVQYTIPSATTSCVDSITINVTTEGSLIYSDCNGVVNTILLTVGITTITNENCISLDSFNGTAEYVINSYGNSCQRYGYPSDIEYYQVLTAITITTTIVNGQPQYSLPNLGTGVGFWSTLNADNIITVFQGNNVVGMTLYNPISPNPQTYPTSDFTNFSDQKVLILQRGVDPYSPLLTNKYGIGKILGFANEDDVIFTASTRMNIPIQKLPVGSTTSVQQHNVQSNIFYSSYVYTPSIPGSTISGNMFIPYKTSNIGYYGALDSNQSNIEANNTTYVSNTYVNPYPIGSVNGVVTKTNNLFYYNQIADNRYDLAEDLSGGAIMVKTGGGIFSLFDMFYYSPILYPTLTGTSSLDITISNRNVMRTDRLPSSDFIDDSNSLVGSVSLLQQNLGFAVYPIQGGGIIANGASFSTGASQVTPDIEGQLASVNVLTTMSTCENMVGLSCYSGNSVSFGVKTGCEASDAVENGCYIMMNKPLIDLTKDIKTFEEWGYRFRFFYGLCRGVLSQSFTNNWVNGTLYAFPIQVDTKYDSKNQPLPPEFAKEIVYFDVKTNNFYYRSSPYYSGSTSKSFIGRPTNFLISPTNTRNLLFPTTIINLGMKDSFYQEIMFEPSSKAYIMKSLNTTSYSDTSDLANLFVISRIANANFLSQIVSAGNNSLNTLFTRPEKRIDGDLAQSMSINSEYGVIPFSPEFYTVVGASTDPVVILGTKLPTMGIFFSSTTEDLQNKDFLTPGVIDFRPSSNANAITYPYGIKSQFVPFYQWELKQGAVPSIFGSEKNNWKTNYSSNSLTSGIFGYNYQSLDRRTIQPNNKYFIGSSTQISDIYERGYIFNVDANGDYSSTAGNYPSNFLVSAPFHFYFGLIKGDSALDKFKTKYSIVE